MTATAAEPQARRPDATTLLIELRGVEKVYRMGRVDYRALRGVDLSIA